MELEEQVTLTCEASGDPIPSITWRTSTRNISSEEKVQCHPRVSGPLARGLNANGVYFMPHALGCARGWDAVTGGRSQVLGAPIPQPSLAVACLASPCNGRGTIPCKDLQGCDVRGCSQVRRYGEERDSHSQAQG